MNLKKITVIMLMIIMAAAAGTQRDAGAQNRPTIFIKNLVPGKGVNSADAMKLSRFIEESVINMGDYDVMSQEMVKELFDTVAKQQILDCNTESCLAQIMNSTQTPYLIYGDLLKEENGYLVAVKLMERVKGGNARIKGSSTRFTRTFEIGMMKLMAGNIIKELHGEKITESEESDIGGTPEGLYRFMVITDPPDAELYINGARQKSRRLTYPQGDYNALLKSPGFEDHKFFIMPHVIPEYNITMKRLQYSITFTLEKGMDEGVDVYDEERNLGTIDKKGLTLDLESGGHILTFKKKGYDDRVETYNFIGSRSYAVKLKKSVYALDVTSSEVNTKVYINGRAAGNAPYSRKYEYGTYTVRVEKEGFLTEEKELELDKNNTLNFTLREKKFVEFRVESKPEGADVFYGGVRRGTAPGTFQFPEGELEVKVVYQKRTESRKITLKPGGKKVVLKFDFSEPEYKMEMVYIKGGTYMMGSPESEKNRSSDEKQHRVTVSPFRMGKYEVTQKQYEEIMGENPSSFKGDNLPVELVSWYNAVEFCNKLNEKHGLKPYYKIDKRRKDPNNKSEYDDRKWVVTIAGGNGFRLPTEAEWEYACRAGTITAFHYGDKMDSSMANFDGNYPYNADKGVYRGKTIAVGSFKPNAYGLYDMHGNVWEWCWDWYGGYSSVSNDPKGADSGEYSVLRGGSWVNVGGDLRSAVRNWGGAVYRGVSYGFRVVRSVN